MTAIPRTKFIKIDNQTILDRQIFKAHPFMPSINNGRKRANEIPIQFSQIIFRCPKRNAMTIVKFKWAIPLQTFKHVLIGNPSCDSYGSDQAVTTTASVASSLTTPVRIFDQPRVPPIGNLFIQTLKIRTFPRPDAHASVYVARPSSMTCCRPPD